MARRARSTGFRQVSRCQTDWSLGFLTTTFTVLAANTKVLAASLSGAALDPIAPSTIIRTRGVISIISDQAASTEDQIGAVGLTFVSDVARAAGVGSVPGPVTDFGWEGWFMHQFFAQAGNVNLGAGPSNQIEIDSKAMRKFTGDDALILVVENAHTSFGLEFAVMLRILIKAG